ncbi:MULTISPECIES: DUF3313 domain-containing protein [Enterobacterales]|jgi:hypothetical protein|uniref:DUF3313 domain-containing protein n=1 Tax=Enterobacterales TaxID=91347 RepID=UPI000F7E3504|nr:MULTISPECIES: DUF3313 domain-containing protein [Enterobacterales]RSV87635.1 DUF3313 domain-containing protein [Klebsiella aerogenes]CAI1183203.1 Protein of uncharacterised function (DUF3313) [Serratia ficaria]CAI1941594.1 Protein of uncharacterised function (DUF3313) [Serratia ficaria]CAI1949189.1 Protein of uncharacterised function (DUF3313) [Serratia ficaria]CAI1999528.1 Protein of uncharacterised function (DUF3313) [Serratia ficaria]
MFVYLKVSRPAILVLAVALAGCAGTAPVRYADIESSSRLMPNADDQSDRIPYRYSTPVDWKKYTGIIIEPVVIYQGADNQFGDVSPEDRKALADYMHSKFSEALRPRFREVSAPTGDAIRLKLTLTGADTTTPFVGTFTKFDLAGGPYNIVQSIRGKEGMLNGSVNYVVEIYDASTQRLLNAYVAKQYPNAMNVGASIGSLSAAEVGLDKGAEELAEILK